MGVNLPQRTSIGPRVPVTPPVWTRQTDWISITGVSTGEILFLVSDATNAIYNLAMTKTGGGNVYIDWGDGVTDTVTSDATYSHTYTTGGTACSLGYNTWKITITSDVSTRITGARPEAGSEYLEYPSGLLEAWYGDTTIITASNYFGEQSGLGMWHTYLEYVKLPNGMTASDSLLRTFFNGCPSLKKITLPTSLSAATTLQETFYTCSALIELSDFPVDMTGVTSMSQTFYQCYSLSKIVLPPSFPSLTTFSSTFASCTSLNQVILPDTPSCTSFSTMFNACNALQSIQIKSMASSGTVDLTNMFTSCNTLRNVVFPNNVSSGVTLTLASTFTSCYSLQSIILPPNVNVSSYASTFSSCSFLKVVSLPMNASSVTSMVSMLSGCNALTSITLPTTAPSAAIPMNNAFSNCYNLSEVTIPSTYNLTTISSLFNGCRNLVKATLPPTLNSLTTIASTFQNCYRLQSVVLPTSMTGVTNMSNMFQNCVSLTGATFPSSMTALDTMASGFINCNSLQTVTLPTTINGNTAACFSTVFQNCFRIKSITLPATITNNTIPNTFASTFNNCYSLKSITLPTSNLTSLATATSTFSGCRSLTGVTNMSVFGNSASGGTIVTSTTLATDARSLLSLTLPSRLTKLEVNGTTGTGNQSNMTSLRLSNVGTGQWGGTSPQIDVSYTSLSTAALNLLFGDMAAQGNVVSKTINITSATGAAGLTAGDRLVITSKGWTITG